MRLTSGRFADGKRIPAEFAFGQPGTSGEPCVIAANRNPPLAWCDVPDGTRSFALFCIDPDAPTVGDDVNQPGRHVPADLPRADFVHWLMVDIPPFCRELGAGSCSEGVTPHGKRRPPGPPGAVQGRNDYTGWFADDEAMAGDYLGYDGPCPPWNDERVHRYRFELYALDVPSLGLAPGFDLAAARRALAGHVLAAGSLTGRYSLNPAARD